MFKFMCCSFDSGSKCKQTNKTKHNIIMYLNRVYINIFYKPLTSTFKKSTDTNQDMISDLHTTYNCVK